MYLEALFHLTFHPSLWVISHIKIFQCMLINSQGCYLCLVSMLPPIFTSPVLVYLNHFCSNKDPMKHLDWLNAAISPLEFFLPQNGCLLQHANIGKLHCFEDRITGKMHNPEFRRDLSSIHSENRAQKDQYITSLRNFHNQRKIFNETVLEYSHAKSHS